MSLAKIWYYEQMKGNHNFLLINLLTKQTIFMVLQPPEVFLITIKQILVVVVLSNLLVILHFWKAGHTLLSTTVGANRRPDQRVLVLTLNCLALKKTGFSLVKNTSQFFFDFFTFILCSWNIKKWTSKVALSQPQTFFLQVRPGCPNQPRIDFSCY